LSHAPGAEELEKVSSCKEIGMVLIHALGFLAATVTEKFVVLVVIQDIHYSADSMMVPLSPTATTQSAA
jgi:hypothetical protein